jgi:hypothetical protein
LNPTLSPYEPTHPNFRTKKLTRAAEYTGELTRRRACP